MTANEAARVIGVSVEAIRKAARRGTLEEYCAIAANRLRQDVLPLTY